MTAARAAGWLSPAVGLGGLLAALVAPVPPALGVAVAVGVSAVGYAALLLGVVPHRGVKLVQGAPFLGVGVLIAGGCGAAGATAGYAYPHAVVVDVPLAAEVPLVGLFFTVGMYLLGLLVVPSIAATFVGRLRRFLDAIGLGVCAFFVAWLLLFADGGMRGGALTAVLLASIALASTVVAGLRAVRFGRAAILCTAGPAGSIAGLTWLTVALDYHAGGYATVPAGLALVGSAALTWYGARTVRANRPPRAAADSDGSFARYPLFALPLVAALVTAGYHLVQHHGLDPVAMTLSLVGVGVVALRETLAALDVRRYAGRLATREAHFRSLVAGSTDVTVVLGPDLVVRWQSPAAARQFGLSDQDVVGRPLLAPCSPWCTRTTRTGPPAAWPRWRRAVPSPRSSRRLRDGYGGWRETEWSLSDQRDVPEVAGLVVHLRDVGERKELERTLHRIAFVDQLTGLANARELHRVLAERSGPGVVMAFGLGGVGGVTDLRGREVGDAVLTEAARRLRAGTGPDDVLARLDGDAFVVVTDGGAVQAHLLATRLLTVLTEPYPTPAAVVHLTAGVGLADLGPEVPGAEALRRADLALRRADVAPRRAGRPAGGVEWYDPANEVLLRRRLAVEQELPGVLRDGGLHLAYQPVVDLATGCAVGAEALLRWRHPTLGTVAAGETVAAAESLGLLDEVGDWILQRACRQLSAWVRDGREVWLSVNLTAGQVAAAAFTGRVLAALDNHQVPAARLVLEIAEAGLAGTTTGPSGDSAGEAVAAHLAELRALGVRAAVDHFGTASTSLSRLRTLPIDLLKVDRQLLIEPARHAGPATAIVDAVVKLGNQIGVEVVAQGLQTPSDVDAAAAAGCRYGQGDVLGSPVPAEHFEASLDCHTPGVASPPWTGRSNS